jgi:DNA polymerase III subunit alpha, Gram-positive type
MSKANLIFYDFETTGLNPFHDEVIEYAFFNYTTGEKLEGFIKPTTPVSSKITRITNITNEMLLNEDTLPVVVPKLETFLNKDNCIFVAHNNDGFDRFFLKRICLKSPLLSHRLKLWKYIDTIHLAKLILPQLRGFSLKKLAEYFNIVPGTHRAMDDTIALKDIYLKLIEKIPIKEPENIVRMLY